VARGTPNRSRRNCSRGTTSACGPIRELARFHTALLAGGALDGRRILQPQTVEALTARHRTGLLDQTFRHVMDWGLGVIPNPAIYGDETVPYAYGRHASRRAVGHSGRRSSTAFMDPEHRLVVALAVNGMPGEDAHRERFRALTEAIYTDLGLVARTRSD
jgi:CubicO group peptidase (beta-lactamase class C family)